MTASAPLAYLATPYSRYIYGHVAAFHAASRLAGRLIRAGQLIYSPIAHTHPIACYGGLDPFDHAIWLPFDQAMMDRCDVLLVAHMDGWQESKGIAFEIAQFEKAGKPIFDLDPKTLTMAKRTSSAAAATASPPASAYTDWGVRQVE